VADLCRELKCTLTWRTCRWPVGADLGLKKGEAACRFLKPVYDGALARVTATDNSLCVESAGLRCATGVAFMPAECRPAPAVDVLPATTLPAIRLKASETSLAPGRAFAIAPLTIDRFMLSIYLDDIRETDPIYLDEGLVHPGQILRLANNALVQNVVLGPWIHVGSKVRNHTAVCIGEQLTLRSKITSNVVSKGHAIVEFDAIVVADGARTVAEITCHPIP
jgi:acyl dehydratase